MRFDLFALYGGPDQVMTVTSGIASIVGVLLIFWNKLVAGFLKLFGRSLRPASPAPSRPSSPSRQDPPKSS